jgi:hypothetical protein
MMNTTLQMCESARQHSAKVLTIFACLLAVALAGASSALADGDGDFSLGGAANFAVLYEGGSGKTLNFNNGAITGNIGIGGTGQWSDGGGCSGQCAINGVVEFSASNSGQFSSNSGTTYTPALSNGVNPLYSQTAVTDALNTVNSLNSTLGAESGTAQDINVGNGSNQTIYASNGTLDSSGNEVFTVSSVSFVNGATLTIDGTSSQYVVLNITANGPHFGGTIDLTGGITSDQVLFNIVGSNNSLTISTNGATETGTFLDPNGSISMNHSVLDGRLFGGDGDNMQIVSGAYIDAPAGPASTPEPASLVLLGTALLGCAAFCKRRMK